MVSMIAITAMSSQTAAAIPLAAGAYFSALPNISNLQTRRSKHGSKEMRSLSLHKPMPALLKFNAVRMLCSKIISLT